jgi:CBS domain containing-hemolysin-like protein
VAAALGIGGFEGAENFDTIAGFLMYSLRKLPRRTDAVSWAGWKFEVVDIEQFRINQVLVTRETDG